MTPPDGDERNAESADQDPPQARNRLLPAIVVAIALGTAVGGWAPAVGVATEVLGHAFLNLLTMLVVPLVLLSMIVGITSLGDIRKLGSLGSRTIIYYFVTTAAAVLVGIVAVNITEPGEGVSPGERHPEATYSLGADGHRVVLEGEQWQRSGYDDRYVVVLGDQGVRGVLTEIGPDWVGVKLWERDDGGDRLYVTSDDGTRLPFRRIGGELVSAEPEVLVRGRGIEIALPVAAGVGAARNDIGATLEEVFVGDEASGKQGLVPRNVFDAMARLEILPLIVFSILVGAALSVLGSRAEAAIATIRGLHDAVMKLVDWIMWLAPVGIFALVAARIGRAGGFAGFWPELMALGKYAGTVVGALLFHALIVLPLILWLVGRRRPLAYARFVGEALLSAVSTSSSSATLPLTIRGVERSGVSKRSAGFVLPLGATINMDGTAMYESVAAIFIAQVYGIELTAVQQLLVFLTATLAAIGAAGIPEAGLVTMVIVLRAVGLPLEGIALILAIDWLLDRCRTTVNVWGDCVGAAVVDARSEQET